MYLGHRDRLLPSQAPRAIRPHRVRGFGRDRPQAYAEALNMAALRRLGYPVRIAAARLAHRGERVVLVSVGIAAGAALLAAVLAGSLVAQDRSLRRALGQVPAGDRTVRVV